MYTRQRCSGRWGLMVVLLAVLGIAVPADGERSRDLAPETDRVLVELWLQLGANPPVVVTVPASEIVSIQQEAVGYSVALMPRVDSVTESVDIDVLEAPARRGDAPGRVLDQLRAGDGYESVTSVNGVPLAIRVLAVGPQVVNQIRTFGSCSSSQLAPLPVPEDEPSALMIGVHGCCVSCLGTTVCGCRVQTLCGSCVGC